MKTPWTVMVAAALLASGAGCGRPQRTEPAQRETTIALVTKAIDSDAAKYLK